MTEPHASPPHPLQGTTAFPFPLTRPSLDTQPGQDPLPQTPVISTPSAREPETRVTLLHHCSTGVTATAATTVGQPSVPGTTRMVPLQSPASGRHGVKEMGPGVLSDLPGQQNSDPTLPDSRPELFTCQQEGGKRLKHLRSPQPWSGHSAETPRAAQVLWVASHLLLQQKQPRKVVSTKGGAHCAAD